MMKVRYCFALLGLLTVLSMPLCGQDIARDSVLHEVEVTAQRHHFGAKSIQMSAIAVSADQIRKMPALMGETDVLKSLQMLPGVQSGGEGRAGIYVRGGDYDQNLFLLDGIPLYNPEHLQGFTSAINADLMDDVVLYKGAFPSQFGSRLSSVVDIFLREGDMEQYHASITAGMLASRIQVEGPLWKGHTSFNIGARLSYFNAIVRPLLEEVVYDNPGQMNEFAHMRYHDINAKLTHRFSEKAKLNAIFYMGHDVNNATPNESSRKLIYYDIAIFDKSKGYYVNNDKTTGFRDVTDFSQRTNSWDNLLGGLFYEHQLSSQWKLNMGLSYSNYDYKLGNNSSSSRVVEIDVSGHGREGAELDNSELTEHSNKYASRVNDWSGKLDLVWKHQDIHEFHVGLQANLQDLNPEISYDFYNLTKRVNDESLIIWGRHLYQEDYTERESKLYNQISGKGSVTSYAAYISEDWNLTHWLELNAGLRLQGYNADSKSHLQVEPRASLRLLMANGLSLKLSYARMSQGIFLLTSGSLINPSEVWMPMNKDMKPGKSDQTSVGIYKDFDNGIQLSLEGYYKWLDNLVDYREGTSFASAKYWNELVAQGKGRAYGVEFLAQKSIGNTRGQVSYTWSKSLRTFDRHDMVINAGREFYASGDRRHNFNINIIQRLSKNWDFSATWTFQSGRRANIATTTMSGAVLDEFNAYNDGWSQITQGDDVYEENPALHFDTESYYENSHIGHVIRMDTYRQRNSYQLPAVHRLDVGFSHHGSIGIGEMICDVGIYNLYNRQNLSSVYWGYTQNRLALKGVCLFPIMPYISLTLKL